MAKAIQSQKKEKKTSIRKQIAEKLTKDFVEIKKAVGEKKFSKRVKKASKILSEGINTKVTESKPVEDKKPINSNPVKAKKAVNKKTVS